MHKRGLSQEGLKLIACITMLIDHIGATIVLTHLHQSTGVERTVLLQWYELLRTVGRISFPIYCFLLSEGAIRTRSPKLYGLRLLLAAVLSEIPYDLAFYGKLNWDHQNVMVTLLLGFAMLQTMGKCNGFLPKLLLILPFAALAEWFGTDYGAEGIFVISVFALTRGVQHKHILQVLLLWFLFSPDHRMVFNWLEGLPVSLQEWAVLAVLPVALYDGRKLTNSKAVQWAFYAFYPAHLLILYLIGRF